MGLFLAQLSSESMKDSHQGQLSILRTGKKPIIGHSMVITLRTVMIGEVDMCQGSPEGRDASCASYRLNAPHSCSLMDRPPDLKMPSFSPRLSFMKLSLLRT